LIFSGSDVCYGEYNKVWEWYREGEGAKLRNEKFLLAFEQLLLPGMTFQGSKKEVLRMLKNRLRRNFHTIYVEVIDENVS